MGERIRVLTFYAGVNINELFGGQLLMSIETKYYISCVPAILFIFEKLSTQRTFYDDGNCLYLLSNIVKST